LKKFFHSNTPFSVVDARMKVSYHRDHQAISRTSDSQNIELILIIQLRIDRKFRNHKFYKMKSLLILISLICFYCSSENENNYLRNQDYFQKWEGWAGAPESVDRKPYEYFYAIQKGNVKLKRIKHEQMEKACIDSVRENGLEKITLMLVGNIFDTMQDREDYSYEPYIKFMIIDFKRHKLKMEIIKLEKK